MQNSISIRPLGPDDSISKLTEMLHAAYAGLAKQGFNFTAADQSDDITRARIAEGLCLVAIGDGGIIGTLIYQAPNPALPCDWYDRPNVAFLQQFAVRPDLQGKGIGSLLLAEAEKRASMDKASEIVLDTSEKAEDLIRWYENRGYAIAGRTRFPGKTYYSAILSKALG